MKISYFPIIVLPVLLGACSLLRTGSSKAELVAWASQIASLEKQMEMEIKNWSRLSGKIESRAPTQDEYKELVHLNDRVNELYNSMIALQPPPEVKDLHWKYIVDFAKATDAVSNYVMGARMFDPSYFEKSAQAAQEKSQMDEDAYNDFQAFLDQYSIKCGEINFCQ